MLKRLKKELHYWFVVDPEHGFMIYLMACGALANIVAIAYGALWLVKHLTVRIA